MLVLAAARLAVDAGLVARLGAARFADAGFAAARLAVVALLFGAGFAAPALVAAAPRFLLAAAPLCAAGFAADLVPFDAEPEAPPFDVPFLLELLRARDVVSPEVLERVAM